METVHILADQEVQSKALRGLLPPARLLLLSYKIPPQQRHLQGNKCSKHQPVETFQI